MKVSARAQFDYIAESLDAGIREELFKRAVQVATKLHNAELDVLAGERHGRKHERLPNRSSAPGEPPATQLGDLREYWNERPPIRQGNGHFARFISRIESGKENEEYAALLEKGTSNIEPRPYVERILKKAEPEIIEIYGEPYSSCIKLSKG